MTQLRLGLDAAIGPIPVWVELFAGTASLGLYAHAGDDTTRLVSYQGNKWGYRYAFCGAVGLRGGRGVAEMVLNDPGDWGAAWAVLSQPVARAHVVDRLEELSWWVPVDADGTPDGVRARELFNRCVKDLCDVGMPGDAGYDGDPHLSVAQFLLASHWSFSGRGWRAGYGGPGCGAGAVLGGNWTVGERDRSLRVEKLIDRLKRLALPPVVTATREDAYTMPVRALPAGSFVVIDPPYPGTTGYKSDAKASPAQVEEELARIGQLALDWSQPGVTVAVTLDQRIPRLDAEGWRCIDTTARRAANARTWSKQQMELLYLSP